MSARDRAQYVKCPSWPGYAGQAGDILSGTVVNRSSYDSEWGKVQVITLLPDEPPTHKGSTTFNIEVDGDTVPYVFPSPLAWHAIGTVAKNAVEEEDPQIGDDVCVVYNGKGRVKEGKFAGKEYDSWTLVVDRQTAAPAAGQTLASVSPIGGGTGGYDADEEPF